MKHIYLLFIVYCICSFDSLSQDVKKGLKQIEKENFGKAEQLLSPMLAKEPQNSLVLYGLAKCYAADEFESKDLYKAFSYVFKAEKHMNSIPVEQMKDVGEYFTNDSIPKLKKRIDDKLFNEVNSQRKLPPVERFIKECPQSVHLQEIVDKRNQLEYWMAKSDNTISSYNAFIRKYPHADEVAEAKKLRNEIAWSNIQREPSIEAYNRFIEMYPNALQVSEAIRNRNNLEYKKAQITSTFEAYDEYVKKYPNSQFVWDAIRYRNAFAYREVQKENSIESYEGFIKKYPDAKQVSQAIVARDELLEEMIQSTSSIEDIDNLLKTYVVEVQNVDTERKARKAKEDIEGDDEETPEEETIESGIDQQIIAKLYERKSEILKNGILQSEKYNQLQAEWIKVIDNFQLKDQVSAFEMSSYQEFYVAVNTNKAHSWKRDAHLYKYSHEGKLLYHTAFGEEYDDCIMAMKLSAEGEIFLTGHYDMQNSLSSNIWVARVNLEGKLIWQRFYEGTDGKSIALTDNGDILIAGYKMNPDGRVDVRIYSLNKEGVLNWNSTIDGKGFPKKIIPTVNNNFIIVGDTWIGKYGPEGVTVFEHGFPEGYKARDAHLSEEGSILVTGFFYEFREENRSDVWVANYTQDGKKRWEKLFDNEKEYDRGISVSSNINNIYIAGLYSQNNDTDDDMVIYKLDYFGKIVEELRWGTEQNEKMPIINAKYTDKPFLLTSVGQNSDCLVIKLQ